jgi:hypothetical protein
MGEPPKFKVELTQESPRNKTCNCLSQTPPSSKESCSKSVQVLTPWSDKYILRTHCLFDGKYSKNTVVSRIRFPPPPKPNNAMKTAREAQFGAAPATVAKIEQMKRDTLNANRRPMISALIPQNKAPMSMPT